MSAITSSGNPALQDQQQQASSQSLPIHQPPTQPQQTHSPTAFAHQRTLSQSQASSNYGNKKLRFITNSAPPSKRRRIGAACLTCRKRKTACSGERPHCETCKQNKLECAGYSNESSTPNPKRSESDAKSKTSELSGEPSPQDYKQHEQQRQRKQMPPPSASDNESKPGLSQQTSSTSRSSFASNSPKTGTANIARNKTPDSTGQGQDPLFSTNRNRMPYFRWLGPTAIMPGFKQMVVKIKRQDTDMGRSSTDGNGVVSPQLNNFGVNEGKAPSIYSITPAAVESDVRTPLSLPFYDTNLAMPPSELITHLANTFFVHLGCNYPFLQRKRFLKDLEEKQVDAILVDAVCAMAARFSNHPLLTQQTHDESKPTPAEYGHAFAQRAKNALLDTFSCPHVAAVQAALLLAYNEFGESRDSGLWMYLGIAIRLAQDLGMHKLEGLKYVGMDGPTPKMVKMAAHGGSALLKQSRRKQSIASSQVEEASAGGVQELRAVEQERVDTFWAIFLLDRYVSSGTGRRSTLRDKDIELSFPSLEEKESKSGWPAPFPALIRIVHLYGRMADLLNSVKEPSDITAETPKKLAAMETQVTSFYQGLSARLHFDAVNFQHYVKAGEGTNFVLLHLWFHVLIILLHQPTLLKTFDQKMLQLFPNSQQLAMSSAKTIADILSYSQLIDAKASLGNPFTTQPIYIAACAFLKETADQTASSNAQSRSNSPKKPISESNLLSALAGGMQASTRKSSISGPSNGTQDSKDPKTLQRHTLLATAASQHYQLCFKALQSLDTYWAGTKYILTVLEQKFEGVADPLLYTAEEGESAMEQPRPEPAFTSPGWRRKLSWERYMQSQNINFQSPLLRASGLNPLPGSPVGDPNQPIGWTLTGTINSPNTNLAWHYASGGGTGNPQGGQQQHTDYPSLPQRDYSLDTAQHIRADSGTSRVGVEPLIPPLQNYPTSSSAVSPSDASLLLGLGSPAFHTSSNHQTPENQHPHHHHQQQQQQQQQQMMPFHTQPLQQPMDPHQFPQADFYGGYGNYAPVNAQSFGDMMIESQDVDMSILGLDTMPWFDSSYLPQGGAGMLNMFDPGAAPVDDSHRRSHAG